MKTNPTQWTILILACLLLQAGMSLAWPGDARAQSVNITTFHGNNARLGWNAHETILTPASVKAGFGKLWDKKLDGKVYGSPLYVSDILVHGQPRNLVYVATEYNSVYALDAVTGDVVWKTTGLAPPASSDEMYNTLDSPVMGVLSTPVIDLKTHTIYVCGARVKKLRQIFVAWALDIRTGALRTGWPVMLKASYDGHAFVGGEVDQRGALTLTHGFLYVSFGGRGDLPPWRGWVIAIDTAHPNAPQQGFCTSPVSDGAGVWSAGGLSVDSQGNVYVATGNGDFDFNRGGKNLGQTIVRLTQHRDHFSFSGRARDYYTPANFALLDDQDEDLGGSTPIVLPDQPATSTPHLLFTGGKDGLAYLVNRDNLGGIGRQMQKMSLFADPKLTYHEGIRSTSAYFDAGALGRFVYVVGDKTGTNNERGVVALRLSTRAPGGPVRFSPAWTLPQPLNWPASPLVSSNGAKDAIVWVVDFLDDDNSILHAYDAMTGEELYRSDQNPADALKDGHKFVAPTVANGRVYVGSDSVSCYGLTSPKEKSAP